jgi:RNA polymerase sigma-70 factor (ECF subfamily)
MSQETSRPGGAAFGRTRWTLVLRARGEQEPSADLSARREALGELIAQYWKPLYFFVRRKGHNVEEAKDLTQAFFTTFLEKDYLKSVDREKGRFRRFLLVALEHFLANEYDKMKAQKRGGGQALLSLDFSTAESHYGLEPATQDTPERLYLRKWATELTARTMVELQAEFRNSGKGELFDAIKPHLAGGENYAALAAKLKITEGSLKVTVHRARQRYRELLRHAVRDTVQTDAEVDAELWELIRSL